MPMSESDPCITVSQMLRVLEKAWLLRKARIDALWGYDVFIAHRRADSAEYARRLHDALTAKGIASFIDEVVYGPGDSLVVATQRHVSKSSILFVVGSPELLSVREPVDWVAAEIAGYLASHAEDPVVLVATFGSAFLDALKSDDTQPRPKSQVELLRNLEPFIRLEEQLGALDTAPSKRILDAVTQRLKGRRRDRSRIRFFQGVAVTLGILLIAASCLGVLAWWQKNIAQQNEARSRHLSYVSTMALASEEFKRGNTPRGLTLLDSFRPDGAAGAGQDVRSFYWYYLWRRFHREDATLLSGDSEVDELRFAPDGHHFASGHGDGEVRLWDLSSRRLEGEFKGPTKPITDLDFSPGGTLLATANLDDTARLWDLQSQQELYRLDLDKDAPVMDLKFSPDGQLLAGSRGKHVQLMDVSTRHIVESIPEKFDFRFDLTFAANGQLLASSGVSDGARVWNIRTGKTMLQRKSESRPGETYDVRMSPDGALTLLGELDGSVELYRTVDARQIGSLPVGPSRLRSLAMTEKADLVAAAALNGEIQLWDVGSRTELASLTGHKAVVTATAFSPDRRWLISGGADGAIKLWRLAGLGAPADFLSVDGSVDALAYSTDGKVLAASRFDANTIELWDTATGKVMRVLHDAGDSVGAVAFSRDGKFLAAGVNDKTVRLWSCSDYVQLAALQGHKEYVMSVAFSPDSRFLASSGYEPDIWIWDVVGRRPLKALHGHKQMVWQVAFSPDGQQLASASDDATVRIWTTRDWQPLAVLSGHGALVGSIAYAPDGKLLASGDGHGAIFLWDTASAEKVAELRGHSQAVNSLSFSPDGAVLASVSEDRTLRLWDVFTRQELARFDEWEDRGLRIAFSPDGLVLANSGKGIRLYHAAEQGAVDRQDTLMPRN